MTTRPVAEAIRNARHAAGLSMREVARRIDVSPATLSAIENAKTGVSVERLLDLAAATGTDVHQLLEPDVTRGQPQRTIGPAPSSTAAVGWREFPPLNVDPILHAAIDAFVATGYHGATMRSVARRAGTSVPGIYHRYRGKQDLLVCILELTMTELHWRVAAARRDGVTSVARVGLIVEALALYHTHRRPLAFIGASEMRSLIPPYRARITQSRNVIQYILDDEINAAVEAGEFSRAHPRTGGRAITTMCTSLPQWFRTDGPSTPEQVAGQYADFALALLRAT